MKGLTDTQLYEKVENFCNARLEENGHVFAEWSYFVLVTYDEEYFIEVILEDEAEHYREQIFLTVYKDRRKRVFMDPEYN